MSRLVLVTALILCFALLTPRPLMGKAPTVRVTLTGPDRSAPINITDSAVREFNIWEGPGVRINGVPQTTGFIVDWANGPTPEPSERLRRYRIDFYTGCKRSESDSCNTEEPQLSYVVLSVQDPATGRAYIYLPGPRDAWYAVNTRSILRGVEGHWFAASAEWQKFMARLTAGAP
jgi:hypothetical protein